MPFLTDVRGRAAFGPVRRRRVLSLASLPFFGNALAQAAAAGPRVALVIGNAAYADSPLRNAVNDARTIAEVLRGHGFTVQPAHDADKAAMQAAIGRMHEELQGRSGVGLLYYAGHGLQLDWHNFMVPIGARIDSAADVPARSVGVQRVLDAFKSAGARMNIVVLDACRDNPFGRLGGGRGLAQMDAPPGTFLAFATAPGNVAEDGTITSGNGPYAHFLAQELQRPDARIEEVFKRVRFAVRRHTAGRQVPWESTSLEEDFSFARGIVQAQRLEGRRRDAAFDEEFAEWSRIKDSTDVEDFYRFLARFPNGLFGETAQIRVERLQRAVPRVAPDAAGVVPPDFAIRRYEIGDVFVWEHEDQLKGTTHRERSRVTAASDHYAEFNGGAYILTQAGGLMKNAFGSHEPPIIEIVPDMAVGRRWRSAFVTTSKGQRYRNFYESKVVALEVVELPLGRVKTFRVEHYGESVPADGRTTRLRRTTWIDVARGMVVRTDLEFSYAGTRPGEPEQPWSRFSRRLVAEERRPR